MNPSSGNHFQQLVAAGSPVGEVVAVNNFIAEIKGMQPVSSHALIVFEDGSRGFVQRILEDRVTVFVMGRTSLRLGMLAAIQQMELTTKVGKDFVGRVISVTGEPLDGKGPIAADANWPVFNGAPPIYQREQLQTQLETGLTLVDAMFPIVRGQRMALLGDSKSGKSTLATQIAINQRNTDQVVIYVLIAKRRTDIDNLLTRLIENKAMDKAVVVVSTIFDSLVMSYLAPYVGCALAEYFWQSAGIDTLIVYDDLTTHAHAYREISLLTGVSPGRDSYPGDIFYAHSSLLERAGKLAKSHKCLTAIPLVLADGGDITAYLPTNIMSITDGQWILDMDIFHAGRRPAISVGLSVTRVGARGHNDRQHEQSNLAFKALVDYEAASELSHFGSELSLESQEALMRGRHLQEVFSQKPGEIYSFLAQQLMLNVILESEAYQGMNIGRLKEQALQLASLVKNEVDYAQTLEQLKSQVLIAQGEKLMRALDDIAEELENTRTILELTSAFEGIASMHISQIKDEVQSSQVFFGELWKIYRQLRVDELFRFGRGTSGQAINKVLLILITSETGLTGDIDDLLIKEALSHYDPQKNDLVVVGHHGASRLRVANIKFVDSFAMPQQDKNINVTPLAEQVQKYQSSTIFYQSYISLMRQEVKRIDLSQAVAELGNNVGQDNDVISEYNYLFEPSIYDVVDHLERSMLQIALSEVILESKLAQYASRFRAMTVAKDRARDALGELTTNYNRARRHTKDERLKEMLNGLRKARQ